MKSDYHGKQDHRRERYETLSEKNQQESNSRFNTAGNISKHIPLGQPILVAHHSEKRHRRDLEKINTNMRKSVEASEKSKHYAMKAASVGTGGISSDNPDALTELRLKYDAMKKRQETMKRINREYKKGGWDAVTGVDEEFKNRASVAMAVDWRKNPKPFESYELTNNNANMRRVAQRIETLERMESEPERPDMEGNGYIIREGKSENRIMIEFDGRPESKIRTIVKKAGFRWAPSVGAWVRMLNNAGRYAAQSVHENLQGIK